MCTPHSQLQRPRGGQSRRPPPVHWSPPPHQAARKAALRSQRALPHVPRYVRLERASCWDRLRGGEALATPRASPCVTQSARAPRPRTASRSVHPPRARLQRRRMPRPSIRPTTSQGRFLVASTHSHLRDARPASQAPEGARVLAPRPERLHQRHSGKRTAPRMHPQNPWRLRSHHL